MLVIDNSKNKKKFIENRNNFVDFSEWVQLYCPNFLKPTYTYKNW